MAVIQSWIDDIKVNLMGIIGLGGMGKSALAAHFYDNFSPNSNGRANGRLPLQNKFWADVSLNPDFAAFAESTIKGLGGDLNPTGDVNILIADLFKLLHQNRCLLVVDNVETLLDESGNWRNESYAMFFQRWKQQGHTSILLLTTQDKPTLYEGDKYWHYLGNFKENEGKTLLKQLNIEGTDTELESLVIAIDGHPLTLNLVAGYLREYCDSQLSQVTELGLDEFNLIYNEASGLHRNITDARLSWILQQHLDRLTEEQRQFLVNLSVYRQAFDVTAATGMYLNANLADGQTQETIKPIEVRKELQNLVNRSLLSRSKEKGYLCPQLLKPYLHKQYPNLTQSHQTAIAYYQSIVTPKPWTNRDDIQGYLEIFYHWYQLGEYDTGFDILDHIDGFMTLQGYYDLQVEYYSDLVRVYQEIGDKTNGKYAASLTDLGNAYDSLGQYQQAIGYYQQCLAITTEIGDRNGEASSYMGLGSAYNSLGQYQQAIGYYQQCLAIKREIGDRNGEANSYMGLGNVYNSLGQYQQAIEYYQQSLAIFTEIGDRQGEASSYNNLGSACNSLGQYQQAIDYFVPALELYQQLGNPHNVILCLDNLGKTYLSLKQYPQAIECYQAILEIKRNLEDKEGEARTLITLGQIYHQWGKPKEGYALSSQGNQILQELGLPVSEMPYPQWLKSLIQFAQRGTIQLILCFVVGVVAFPFAFVGFILRLIWRWVINY